MHAIDDDGREFTRLWGEMTEMQKEAMMDAFRAADPLSPSRINSVTFFKQIKGEKDEETTGNSND